MDATRFAAAATNTSTSYAVRSTRSRRAVAAPVHVDDAQTTVNLSAVRLFAGSPQSESSLTYNSDEQPHAEVKHSLDFILNMAPAAAPHYPDAAKSAWRMEVSHRSSPLTRELRACQLNSSTNTAPPATNATRPRPASALRPTTRSHFNTDATTATSAALPSRTIQKAKATKKQQEHQDQPAATTATKKLTQSTGTTKPLTYEEKRLARQCTIDGCVNYTINKGLCFRHGGGKKCTMSDCNASAKVAGLCWKHGGSVQCSVKDCDRRGKSRGLCWAHGGGTKCQGDGCSKVAVSNGFCWAHGGGKRCLYDGCQRPAYERTYNYCPKHFNRYEEGEEVMEV